MTSSDRIPRVIDPLTNLEAAAGDWAQQRIDEQDDEESPDTDLLRFVAACANAAGMPPCEWIEERLLNLGRSDECRVLLVNIKARAQEASEAYYNAQTVSSRPVTPNSNIDEPMSAAAQELRGSLLHLVTFAVKAGPPPLH